MKYELLIKAALVVCSQNSDSNDINLKMDQEKQRERKQLFLRQQIIQKGFDPGEFVDYLSELKLAQDVDLLTLNEVKQAVESFKAKKLAEGDASFSRSSRSSVTIPEKEMTKTEQRQTKTKQVFYEKYGVYEDEFQRSYKCTKFTSYPKNKSLSPLITVSDPQRKTAGGFFFGVGSTSFITFKIDTPQYGWSVRRRYSDFQWLHTMMMKLFPSHVLPPLPKKDKNKRSARDIQKRMMLLEYLLNDISNIPSIMHNRYVLGFLSVSEAQFDELKREGSAQKGFQIITELETESGNLNISLTNKQKTYLAEIDKFSLSSQNIYKEMTASSKSLQSCFIQQTNTLYKIGNLYADLYCNLKEFNSKVPQEYQQNSMLDIFVVSNNMLVEWGNIVREQHGFIQKNFNAFIRYSRNEIYSLRDQLAKVQNIEQEFFKASIQLDKKKEKIFNMGDFSKWDVPQEKYPTLMQAGILKNREKAIKTMLPKETYQIQKLRTEYGFYASQFCEHSYGMLQRQSLKLCENFKEFAITIKVNAQQLSQMWNEVSGNFSNPKKKEIAIQNPHYEEKSKEEMYDDG